MPLLVSSSLLLRVWQKFPATSSVASGVENPCECMFLYKKCDVSSRDCWVVLKREWSWLTRSLLFFVIINARKHSSRSSTKSDRELSSLLFKITKKCFDLCQCELGWLGLNISVILFFVSTTAEFFLVGRSSSQVSSLWGRSWAGRFVMFAVFRAKVLLVWAVNSLG